MDLPTGKARMYWLIAIGMIVATVLMTFTAKGQIVLPAEAVVAQNTSVSRTFTKDAAGTDSLYMQINNHFYVQSRDAKMSVRVNGGSWTDITNTVFDCYFPDENYDCVGGSRSTIKGRMAISGFVDGSNTIDWRFNASDGNTSGFRILDFNLIDDGAYVLAPGDFSTVDPTTWTHDAAMVAGGAALFNDSTITISDIDGTISNAVCRDCHFKGGMDLKMLAYSDESIVTRSVFHGMSTAQGDSIAAYIRANAAGVVGRPWLPNFQPGPGLDAGTAAEWFAGAGEEYVLDDDIDALPYFIAQIDSLVAIHGDDITKGDLNRRELPTAFMYPDWNQWLPRIHPLDLPGDFAGSAWNSCVNTDLVAVLDGSPTPQQVAQKMEECWGKSSGLTYSDNDSLRAIQLLSWRQYRAVRWLDLHFEYDLFDDVPTAYPAVPGDGRTHGQARGTLGIVSPTFTISPHRISSNDNDWPYLVENNGIFSSAWYRVAVTLNPGWRYATEQNVIDWKYQLPHVANNTQSAKQVSQFIAHTADWLTLMQQSNKDLCSSTVNRFYNSYSAAWWNTRPVNVGQCAFGIADDSDADYGWIWNLGSLSQAGATLSKNGSGEYTSSGLRAEPTAEQARQALEPIVKAWFARTDLFDWDTGFCQAPADEPTNTVTFRDCLTAADAIPLINDTYKPTKASVLYNRLGRLFPSLGMTYDVMLPIAQRSDARWTNASPTYVSVIGSAPSPPGSTTLSAPADAATSQELDVTLSWGAATGAIRYQLEYDDSGSGFPSPVTVEQTGLTYQPNFVSADGSTYHWRVRGENSGGDGAWSTTRSFTLRGTSLFTERDSDNGTFTEAGSVVTITDTTGASIYKLDRGIVAANDTLFAVADSVSRSSGSMYNWGVGITVEDTTDANNPFVSIQYSDTYVKLYWNIGGAAYDSAQIAVNVSQDPVFYAEDTPVCMRLSRAGDVVKPEWAYYLTGACSTWTTFERYADDSVVTVTLPSTTNYVGSAWIRSRVVGVDATGYLKEVTIQ